VWTGAGRSTDFYTVKGLVERLFAGLGLRGESYVPAAEPYLHPGQCAEVRLGDQRMGVLGLLRPDIAAAFGIEEHEVYVAELSVDELAERAFPPRLFEDLVTFPPATQDLAVVVERHVPAADVVAVVQKAGGKLLRSVRVFDVYEGEPVPAGKRSLALRLVMRSPERTLSEKDINAVRQRVLSALQRELGASLR
jgi:phenylalanyl-tRNA synthetase beta chain